MPLTTHPGLRVRALLCLSLLSTLALSACEDDKKDSDSSAAPITAPAVPLQSREDVIAAVSALWTFSRPWMADAAPAREADPDGATEGTVTVDCQDGGRIVYDEDLKITAYEDCVVVQETADEEAGTSEVLRLSQDGLVSEDCAEEGPADALRCLTAMPLDLQEQQTLTEPPPEGESGERVSRFTHTVALDARVSVMSEDAEGYRLLLAESREERRDTQTPEGNSSTRLRTETDSVQFVMQLPAEEGEPALLDMDGELQLEGQTGCPSGLIRFGTTSPLSVDLAQDQAPSAGRLVLSTDVVGAVGVDFGADGSISFRLAGEDLTATAEELASACLQDYPFQAGGEQPSDDEEICLIEPFLCF